MVRVGIYNRCSTEEEAQMNALEIQAAESLEIAENKALEDWVVMEQYIESESGTTVEKRKEYLRMVTDIEAGRFDVIMVKSIDRLARNTKDWYLFLDCLVRNNTRLFLYLENKFYQSEDALVSGIKAILAEEFSKELSAKIKNAHKRRQQKQTGYNITREMFGWNKIKKDVYEINQEEAEYFYKACNLVEEGFGFRRIANALYEAGARNKNGTRISEVQWRNMLRADRAYGAIVLHKEEYDFFTKKRKKLPKEEWIYIENALPPLITKEYHKKLSALLDERAKKQHISAERPNNAGKYPLSGKIICGCCGSPYYRTKKIKDGKEVAVWKCSKYLREGVYHPQNQSGCSNIKIEETALLQKIAFFYTKNCANHIFEKCDKEDKILLDAFFELLYQAVLWQNAAGDMAKLVKKQEKLNQDKEKMLRKLLDDVVSDEDYKRYQKKSEIEARNIEKRMQWLQKEVQQEEDKKTRIIILEEYVVRENLLEKAKIRELFQKLEKVTLYSKEKLEISFL